ncbi:hypothetical protein pdam_00010261 [Pocillopora damicornis]|uniref:Uncharacterized protein n=1 Tax=Pocillopora damicornis TaxID=46731 RepID=A0A3M6TMQ5_POCDA|nr:hypothetical protein pdam_00010261 [Pocillopora damicornis]
MSTSDWAWCHEHRVQKYQIYLLIHMFISRNITKILPRPR